MNLAELASANDVLAAARFVLGDDFAPPRGVIQTCAVDGSHRVIRIGEQAPKSAWDFFLLNLARASADAIVTTGKILRDEPSLRYDLQGPGTLSAALHAYRVAHARKAAPAKVVVLTHGDVSLDHGALHGWAAPVIATDSVSLADRARARGMEILTLEALDTRALVTALRASSPCVSVEAGPSAARALYAQPTLVDTLLLSRFDGALAEEARGLPFLPALELEAGFGRPLNEAHEKEPSGPWTFFRYAR